MYNSVALEALQPKMTVYLIYPSHLISQLEYPLGEIIDGCYGATIIQQYPVVSPKGNHTMQHFVFCYYLGQRNLTDNTVSISIVDNDGNTTTKIIPLQPNDVVFNSFDELKRAIEDFKETYKSLTISVENSRSEIDRILKLKNKLYK